MCNKFQGDYLRGLVSGGIIIKEGSLTERIGSLINRMVLNRIRLEYKRYRDLFSSSEKQAQLLRRRRDKG